MWTCSTCGEKHEDEFDSCWKCALRPGDAVPLADFKPVVSQTGGLRVDGFNATDPFATLSANSDAIHLSCRGREYHFPRSTIRRLSRHRGWVSVGLRIEHTQDSLPEFVFFWASEFFWTSRFEDLKRELEGLGYEIAA
jgi:hypothetical protein